MTEEASWTIRTPREEDLAAIARLAGELGYPSTAEDLCGRWGRIHGSADHAVFVAMGSDGNLYGWIHVFTALYLESSPSGEIGGLVVTEDQRGEGVGGALLQRAEKWARQRRMQRLRVRTRMERKKAQRFYERLGFKPTKVQQVLDKELV